MKKKRTLYDCSHPRVEGKRIYCSKGHPLSLKSGEGSLDIKRLARGELLALSICQQCKDFDSMGTQVPEGERGWAKKEARKHGAVAGEALREAVAPGGRQAMD